MLAGTASHRHLVRVAAFTGALLLATFAASGARVAIPGLREATRGLAAAGATARLPVRWRGRFKAAAGSSSGTSRVARVLRALSTRWVYAFPTLPSLPFRPGRPHGAWAGSGVLRRNRWASLGGHGRNGPGAGI